MSRGPIKLLDSNFESLILYSWHTECKRTRFDREKADFHRAFVIEFKTVHTQWADFNAVDHNLINPDGSQKARSSQRQFLTAIRSNFPFLVLA